MLNCVWYWSFLACVMYGRLDPDQLPYGIQLHGMRREGHFCFSSVVSECDSGQRLFWSVEEMSYNSSSMGTLLSVLVCLNSECTVIILKIRKSKRKEMSSACDSVNVSPQCKQHG